MSDFAEQLVHVRVTTCKKIKSAHRFEPLLQIFRTHSKRLGIDKVRDRRDFPWGYQQVLHFGKKLPRQLGQRTLPSLMLVQQAAQKTRLLAGQSHPLSINGVEQAKGVSNGQ